MNTRKAFICKVCGKTHSANGFCKYHNWAFSKNKIDHNGLLAEGYFYNNNKKIRKKKNTLYKTVKESNWYREWQKKTIIKNNRRCNKCGKSNIQLVVHHAQKRFADIIKEARFLFNDMEKQMEYCRIQHTEKIGETLCNKCHAEKHKGEKVYSSLLGKVNKGKCKVCGSYDVYCRQFCSKHYRSFCNHRIDINGKYLVLPKLFDKKPLCIVCGNESVGRGGIHAKFCHLHLSRYHSGIIDENGKQLREFRILQPERKCKISGCGKKHSSSGFCYTHYNRYRIGQIDINGKELRKLEQYRVKGSVSPEILISFNGQNLSVRECAKLVGVHPRTMAKRLKKWSVEKALTTPKMANHDTAKYKKVYEITPKY
jgi:hypothetical protein